MTKLNFIKHFFFIPVITVHNARKNKNKSRLLVEKEKEKRGLTLTP